MMESPNLRTSSLLLRNYAWVPLILLLSYLGYKFISLASHIRDSRKRHNDIPGLPRHWLWGNLIKVGQHCNPKHGRHPDYGFEEIWNELGQPPCFLLDLLPVETHSFLIVADPEIAEACAQPSAEYKYSIPKSETMSALKPLIGTESIFTAEGEEWKHLRRRFNRGFAPSHLNDLSPWIVAKTRIFVDRIRDAARREEVVPLKRFAQDLTTDIITQLTFEKDFESQSIPEGEGAKSTFGVLTALRILSSISDGAGSSIDPLRYLNPLRRLKQLFYERLADHHIYTILASKLQIEQTQPKKRDPSTRSVVHLALADLPTTPALLTNTVAQIKSFLFAGQDTTATLIQWLSYELSKPAHAPILKTLCDEHDAVFGPGAFSALDNPDIQALLPDKLPYTTAFIKETLRLHPPAGSARQLPASPPFRVNVAGASTRIDGLRIYTCQHLLHRNPRVWGPDATVFRPERWLDEEYMSKLPAGASRVFERGPRNCIGQELAMLEAKVVLVAVARGVGFEKVGVGAVGGEGEVWSVQQITSVPVDGMEMRFHLKE